MKFFSTPAWSLGTKTNCEPQTTDKFTPGPGTYELRDDNIEVPAPKFGKDDRGELFTSNDYPAPNRYFDDILFTKSKSHKQIKPTHPKEKTDKNKIVPPGPGSYNPQKTKVDLAYSMGNKVYAIPEFQEKALGPGQYDPDFKAVFTERSTKFAKTARSFNYDTGVPGPGAYEPTGDKGISAKFGVSERDKLVDNRVPGPGAYPLNRDMPKNGKSLTARRPLPGNKDIVPGPGAYDMKPSHSSPAFAVGSGLRSNFIKPGKNPAPGCYDPIDNTKPKSFLSNKVGTMGKGQRPPLSVPKKSPGPGTYYPYTWEIGGLKTSFSGKRPEPKINENPGPGQYDPLGRGLNTQGTGFGKGLRSGEIRALRNRNPGPGEYGQMYLPRCCSGGWTFGKDPRSKEIDDDEPGPGHYDIPPAIPDVPKYLMLQNNLNQNEQ